VQQLSEAAQASFVPWLNTAKVEDVPSYSKQLVWKARCGHAKHMRYMQCQQVTRTGAALPCRACQGFGSSYEKTAYAACNRVPQVKAWAAEAHAVRGQYEHEGQLFSISRHSWDIVILKPCRVLIEVQGEQHTCKLNTQANSNDDSLASRHSRDRALAEAAVALGYSVVWLLPGEERGRLRRWTALIEQAVRDRKDKDIIKIYP
jgi:hypothetical protein